MGGELVGARGALKGPDLSVQIATLKLEKPSMLASGILGLSSEVLKRIAREGAGAVVTKSIGLQPREGYKGPVIVGVKDGFINALGLPNPGAHEFAKELSSLEGSEIPVIVSVFGSSPEEFSEVIRTLDLSCAKAFELNLSCPHVEGVGTEVGQDPGLVEEVVRAAKKSTGKPVIAKLSSHVTDIVEIGRAAERGGADAMTAINTLRAMAIDIEAGGRPVLFNRFGGLSGAAIKPVALRCVYELSSECAIPVIGCGGVQGWEDALEFIMAGASAVQVGSALAKGRLGAFKDIEKGIGDYLRRKGLGSVSVLVGIAHRA